MKVFRILFVVFFLSGISLLTAQEDAVNEKGPIDNQFKEIIKKSGSVRGTNGGKYQVVRSIFLNELHQNVLDSLKGFNARAATLKSTIVEHESSISTLNKKLEETTNNLTAVTEEKDSMSFLGILVSKATYNTILWSIIAALLAMMLFFMYKFRRSNILTQEAKTSLSEVEKEYEDHRRRALEREQRISRQLQDEINKYKKAK